MRRRPARQGRGIKTSDEATGAAPALPYADLTPPLVLDALDAAGLRGDGRLIQLNSYENRVFQAFLEDGRAIVAKFYRPGRWSDAQILEEHAFAAELAAAEIPVAAPQALEVDPVSTHAASIEPIGTTLARYATPAGGHRFGVTERKAGRAPELDAPGVLRWIGRYLGRLHAIGRRARFEHRLTLDVATYGEASRDVLLARGHVAIDVERRWGELSAAALDACRAAFGRAAARPIRLHGDCHPGNILWSDAGPHFVDLDDAVAGPAVQDLWMLLSGSRAAMSAQLGEIVAGYESFAELDRAELGLIEPLRTLRMLHHSAWIARRWDDPTFPINFPWFASPAYWADQCTRLAEQLDAMAEPPLGIGASA